MLAVAETKSSNFELEVICKGSNDPTSAATTAKARDILQNWGVVVLRNAFSPERLTRLFENLLHFRDKALAARTAEGEPDFPPNFLFTKQIMAADLCALDPATEAITVITSSEHASAVIEQTTLLREIKSGPGGEILRSLIPEGARFYGSYVRVIDQHAGARDDRRGAVFFHQEKWVADVRKHKPGGMNIWVSLNPDKLVVNSETSGVQFALGEIDFWRTSEREGLEEGYEKNIRPRLVDLNQAGWKTLDDAEEIVEKHGKTFYRPHLRVGDLIVFDHHIPHASFVPASAIGPRVSCEMRIWADHCGCAPAGGPRRPGHSR